MDLKTAMDSAIALHRDNRVADAEAAYEQILNFDPNQPLALHNLGLLKYQQNQLVTAVSLLTSAAAVQPLNERNHYTLALAHMGTGQRAAAIAALRCAIEIKPQWPEALFALGSVLEQSGENQEAIEFYQRAIAAKPDCVDAWINLGNIFQSSGRLHDSINAYRQALGYQPQNANAHTNLGSALKLAGDRAGAMLEFRTAVACDPQSPVALHNLGAALVESREFLEATSVLRRALALQPQFAEAWFSLGNALHHQRQHAEATEAFTAAIRYRPDYVAAYHNLGNAHHAAGNHRAAADAYRQAIKLQPSFLDAYNNLGCLLRTLGHLDEAAGHLRTALALRPDFNVTLCNLGNVYKDAGRIEEAIDLFRRAIDACPADVLTHSNLAYSLHFDPRCDAADILRENQRWNTAHGVSLSGEILRHVIDSNPDRRLKVGYIGSDFREHCQSLFTIPLFTHHDRTAFEVFCYADVNKPDKITEQLKRSVGHWRDIAGLSDPEVAALIYDDHLDVLVDLTMHMSRGRPLVMARKPAPVQVAWLAYPGTTGLSAIDYRLTDPYLDPEGSDGAYVERSHRLPDTFWCYDPLCDEPDPGPLPADTNGFITFGCLNNFCKITTATLELWSQVLATVGSSHLILLAGEGEHRQRLLDFFRERNIDAGRIRFEKFQPRPQYLCLYQQIDIGLDTIPYNGHTTSLDSFWMGVPVVTRVGRTAVGRAGLSQLSNLDLTELAAHHDEAFVTAATGLANDLDRLRNLRETLRRRMQASPLMDAARFARGIETFYRSACSLK